MHIVFISGEYPLWTSGGVGTFIATFGKGLISQGHSVSVIGVGVTSREVVLEDGGITLYRIAKNTSKWPNFLVNSIRINRKLHWLDKKKSIDIIETAEGGLAFISKKHSAKKIVRLHGGHHFFAEAEKRGINWRKGIIEKRSFEKAHGFIAVSNYVRSHTAKYLSYGKKPIIIIPSPIATTLKFQNPTIDFNHIVFAGTVCEKKGIRFLLQAFKIVRSMYPEMKLDIYGKLDWKFPNGILYINYLRNELANDFFENVIFHGSISRDLLDFKFAQAAFCIFPSLMETQGLVIMEAMAQGKLVIFSKYGPGPETIRHGITGFLVDVYKPKDIVEKINWCIEHPEQVKKIGKAAQDEVLKKYDIGKIVSENIAFYQKILEL